MRLCGRITVWLLMTAVMSVGGLPIYSRQTSSRQPQSQPAPPQRQMNVLMIAVDDLRPEIGAYGVRGIKTPNIDRLASSGTAFTRAYCQQAVCSPSRTSLLTGRRPDTTRIYDLQTHFRGTIPDVVTLPQHFRAQGYHTQGFSKIYHGGLDDPASWSVPHWTPKAPPYGGAQTLAELQKRREQARIAGQELETRVLQQDPKTGARLKVSNPRNRVNGPSWEAPDVADNALPDGQTADKAVETLQQIKDKPFFLAIGFLKPHLPFVAPKKYYDLYPKEQFQLASNPNPPADAPEIALHNSGELRNYNDIPKTDLIPNEKALELRRAYYAATSYTDAQIGRVINELERLGLRDRTVIVLWGDHGWQLGEHGMWCKHSNFETSTRAPLIISAPGQKRAGTRPNALVEFVDIYPTLAELCGLPLPQGLEGISFAPLLNDPNRKWKPAAFSQYPRQGDVMGYSMRTDRYRYTEWLKGKTKELVAVELYDHETDADENTNIAARSEHKRTITKLSKQLAAGWKGALPSRLAATSKF